MRGEPLADELCWVGPDPATRRGLAISSTPHHGPDGRLQGVVLVFKDVTDLIRALRVKDEFVASVSHELRTPLTSIIGYVDVVLEDTDDVPDGVRRHLEAVSRNSRRLRRLVDDLLTTAGTGAAGDAGLPSGTDLRLAPASVHDLLRTCTDEARGPATEKGLTVELVAPDSGTEAPRPLVLGDEERLAQVFDNLLGNAVKYTPAGGVVRAGVTVEADHVVARVSDTGRGIAEEDLAEIFEVFYRTDDVQGDAIPGVGLGLAITKRLVEAHGGHITATSRLGEGTTMEVRLPRAQASLPTKGVE
jgi:signal transduction histidine kinase